MKHSLLAVIFLLLGTTFLPARKDPAKQSKPTQTAGTIKVTTREVVVDVVVTDRRGNPVRDLMESDFKVFENGRPQQIVDFQRHAFQPGAVREAAIQLPKGEYSNIAVRAASFPALNIVLFDVLNTTLAAQMDARRRLIQFLRTLPAGRPAALFILREQLSMVAGFTNDPARLVAAAKKLLPYESAWHVSKDSAELATAQYNELLKMVNAGTHGQTILPYVDVGAYVNGLRSWGLGRRALITAEAFDTLAHAVAGYPGRKNLLWLSSGFPVNFDPIIKKHTPQNNFLERIALPAQTASLLSSSRVAVYPIDITGLVPIGASAATPGAIVDVPQAGSLRQRAQTPLPAYASLTNSNEDWLVRSHQMLRKIAEDTGGHAYFNSNDLKSALRRAVESGSDYYTLAYAPPEKNWNGSYRHIAVRVDRPGLALEYRRGYYASRGGRKAEGKFSQAFVHAMCPGIPQSSMLPFTVNVTPPKPGDPVLRIEYHLSAQSITFSDSKTGRKQAEVKVVAVPYTREGKPLTLEAQTVKFNLVPAHYTAMLGSGIVLHQQVRLQPGNYDLRIGVEDESTGSFGTIYVPLHAP